VRARPDLIAKFECLNTNNTKEGKTMSSVAEYMYHCNAQKPT
jgi:hypothetical protein